MKKIYWNVWEIHIAQVITKKKQKGMKYIKKNYKNFYDMFRETLQKKKKRLKENMNEINIQKCLKNKYM